MKYRTILKAFGIGGLILLCLIALIVGYLLMNPAERAFFTSPKTVTEDCYIQVCIGDDVEVVDAKLIDLGFRPVSGIFYRPEPTPCNDLDCVTGDVNLYLYSGWFSGQVTIVSVDRRVVSISSDYSASMF